MISIRLLALTSPCDANGTGECCYLADAIIQFMSSTLILYILTLRYVREYVRVPKILFSNVFLNVFHFQRNHVMKINSIYLILVDEIWIYMQQKQ